MSYSIIVDIGNTSTNIGIFKFSHLVASETIINSKDPDFGLYIKEFRNFKEKYNIKNEDITGGLISSVVPILTRAVQIAINNVFGIELPVFDNSYKINFEYDIDNPKEVGSDLIANLVYAKEIFGDATIIFDLGTVSKYIVLDKNGVFIGCGFAPGLQSTINGCHNKSALLPELENFDLNNAILIGKNTIQAMTNGVYYMTVEGILGICRRIENELGYHLKKILTGGNAIYFKNELSSFFYDPNFTLKGINYIYDINRE